MSTGEYDSLVVELTSFVQKYKELNEISKDAELDLKWRLTELFKTVEESDEQKFIDISGLQGHLMTTQQKKHLAKLESEKVNSPNKDSNLSEITQISKRTTDKAWAKSLYRRAVRRCHPDTIKISDDEYKKELTQLYKDITESYENDNLDILMIEAYKIFIKPKKVIGDQIEILENSKKSYHEKIKTILESQAYAWAKFDDALKENFLINLMKQSGVNFVDKEKVREVLNRKIINRKVGQKPKNNLRMRVKNKK
jgi:hypothetical protein